MRKQIIGVCLLLLLCVSGFAQKETPNSPVLLSSVEPKSENVGETIKLITEKVKESLRSQEGFVAIRVCSKNALPIALANARGFPFATALHLEFQGVQKSKVFYLRDDKNCKLYRNDFVTEYWFVPKGAEFPSFIELRRASNLDSFLFVRHSYTEDSGRPIAIYGDETELTEQSFNQMLKALTEFLKNDISAVVVIENIKSKKSANKLNTRVNEIKKTLLQQGVAPYRVFIKDNSWGINEEFPEIWVISEK